VFKNETQGWRFIQTCDSACYMHAYNNIWVPGYTSAYPVRDQTDPYPNNNNNNSNVDQRLQHPIWLLPKQQYFIYYIILKRNNNTYKIEAQK